MILPSTIRKLQAKGASVFRVTIPAHVVDVAFAGAKVDFPKRVDYFASAGGAQAHASAMNPAQWGVADAAPKIDVIPAAALDPLFGCEVAS